VFDKSIPEKRPNPLKPGFDGGCDAASGSYDETGLSATCSPFPSYIPPIKSNAD